MAAQNDAAVAVQTAIRGRAVRQEMAAQNDAAVTVQAAMRGKQARSQQQAMADAADKDSAAAAQADATGVPFPCQQSGEPAPQAARTDDEAAPPKNVSVEDTLASNVASVVDRLARFVKLNCVCQR
eukprot:2372477-Prymnesium_polylepis.1